MKGERIAWVDGWKGILILLVVLGHVVGGALHLVQGSLAMNLNKFFLVIYAFHMPAFFFVTGCLAVQRAQTDEWGTWLARQVRRLLVPYWVFGVCSVVLYWLIVSFAGNAATSATDGRYFAKMAWSVWSGLGSVLFGAVLPGTDGFRCNSVLWFLPCLFSVLLLDFAIGKVMVACKRRYSSLVSLICVPLGLTLAACFAVWNVPNLPYGLSHVPWYFAYFSLGRVFGAAFKPLAWGGLSHRVGWGTLGLGALIVYGVVCWVWPCYHRDRPEFLLQIGVLVLALWGIGVSLLAARLFPVRWLAALGQATIGIMFVHKFIVVGLQHGFPFLRRFWAAGVWPCVLGIVVVTVVATLISYLMTRLLQRFVPWAVGVRGK